jgi:hypothetical protein
MERLVMHALALGDGKSTLPERIIRHVQRGAGDAPTWATTSQPGSGYAPTAPTAPTGSSNGLYPQQPAYPRGGGGGTGGYGSGGGGSSF